MNFQQIWGVIGGLLGGLKDPAEWKATKDGSPIGPVTDVTIGETDARLTVKDGGAIIVLEAKAGSLAHADVYVNGSKQDDARLVVGLKSQLPFRPLIAVLTFKHVQADGGVHDYRFDNPC